MPPISSIQVLRALAALMVVVHHVQPDAALLAQASGSAFHPAHFLPWMAGVDIFFVVSGFIMVHSSRELLGRPGAAGLFLRRRLVRIVPLYWAMTGLFLLVGAVKPSVLNSGPPDAAQILGSLLFWPMLSTQGFVQPVYSLGWTLNYEMLFYGVFAAALLLPARWVLPAVSMVLAGLVATEALQGPLPLPFGFWGQPIVLEFAAGMGLAVLRGRGLRLNAPMRGLAALAGVGVLLLAARQGEGAGWSVVAWNGSAAVLLVLSAACGREGREPPAAVKALARLGDASYALYLVHPFVIRGLRELVLQAGGVWPLAFVALAMAASVLAALLLHAGFERPMLRLLRRRPVP